MVPAIHAALPVLRRSFLATNAASTAASLPRVTMEEREIFARTEPELLLGLSGSETPPLRDAMGINQSINQLGFFAILFSP